MTYPVLAQTLADHPALQIFRSYSALNVKSILYYQAELAHLESELADIETADRTCSEDKSIRREYAEDWWSLKYGARIYQCAQKQDRSRSPSPRSQPCSVRLDHAGSRVEDKQWRLMCRIRVVLEEYYQAMSRQLEIENDHRIPKSRDLMNLRGWFDDSQLGKCFLIGKTEDTWDVERGFSDYVAMAETGDTLSNRLAWLFLASRRFIRRRLRSSVKNDSVESLGANDFQRMMNSTLTVLASVLPVLPIVVLLVVKPMAIRLGLVFLFTLMLSATATFGLRISAERVLAITTAYAAVLVVFITTNQNG